MMKKIFLLSLLIILIFVVGFFGLKNFSVIGHKEKGRISKKDRSGSVFIKGQYYSIFPAVGIFREGSSWGMSKLLGSLGHGYVEVEHEFSVDEAIRRLKLLILPSASLSDDAEENLKNLLEEWVRKGGALLILSQAYGKDYSVLPFPSNHPIIAYGYKEFQSCKYAYVFSNHPALSGIRRKIPIVSLDGYFESLPDKNVVLLRDIRNFYPVLAYYRYGKGYVILTSMYEDWEYVHKRSSRDGRAIIRDLITWAKAPDMEIPVYTLPEQSEGGSVEVSLNLEVENESSLPASKAKLLWLTPDRSRVAYEEEREINLAPGESTTLSVSHSFDVSQIPDSDLGIWHLDYQLYDSDGNLIQPERETPTGRFAFRRPIRGEYRPHPVQIWITVEGEDYIPESEVTFYIHLKNNLSRPVTGKIEVSKPWKDKKRVRQIIGEYTLKEKQERIIKWKDVPPRSFTYRFYWKDGETSCSTKGVWIKPPDVYLTYSGLKMIYRGDKKIKFELVCKNETRFSFPVNIIVELYNSKQKIKKIGSYKMNLKPLREGKVKILLSERLSRGKYRIVSRAYYFNSKRYILIDETEREFIIMKKEVIKK